MGWSGKRLVVIAAIVFVLLCLAAFLVDRYTLAQTYARVPDSGASLLPAYELYEEGYPRSDVEFRLDGATLRGHVYGEANDRGLVIFRHGMFSQHRDYLALITALVDKGWRVFAYDAIGCGESDGDSTLGMSQSPLDVAAAIDYARESGMAEGMPVALWGHSWGGYGVAAALGLRAGVDACVTMSGFDAPMKELDYSAEASFGLAGKLQYPFLWLNTVLDFGENADRSASEAIASSGVPTLVIHGAGDTTVPYDGVSVLGALQSAEGGLSGQVRFVTKDDPGRDGHNSYFYSPESKAYLDECVETLQELLDENDDDAGAPEVTAFLDGVDLKRANTADPALIDEIDSFLATATGAGE